MKYKISLSQLKRIVNEEITEAGKKGMYLKEWTKDDQTIAFYLVRCGEDLGLSKKEIAENYIGSSLDSLVQQMANFKFLMDGTGGLDRPNKLQTIVYEEFKYISCMEFKNIVKTILNDYSTEGKRVNRFRLGREMGDRREKRDSDIYRTLDDYRSKNPELRGRKLTHINTRPKNPVQVPLDEPEEPTVPIKTTSLDDVKDYLTKLVQTVNDIQMSNDMSMLDSLKDDIEFIREYINNELSPKLAEQRRKNRIKNIIKEALRKH
jgi:hypothetical protein